MNFYKILGLAKTATREEIRQAHRILVKRYHPDINPGNEKSFKLVQTAFEALTKDLDLEGLSFSSRVLKKTFPISNVEKMACIKTCVLPTSKDTVWAGRCYFYDWTKMELWGFLIDEDFKVKYEPFLFVLIEQGFLKPIKI